MRRLATSAVLLFAGLLTMPADSPGDEPAEASREPQGPLNLQTPTLGGMQFWGDELLFHDWRIQRNTVTGHCRLLDGNDQRCAWGTFEVCEARLNEIKVANEIEPMRGKVVLALHGLFRTRDSMNRMAEYLKEHGDYQVLRVSYPSSRAGIDEHARALASIVEHLPEVDEIHIVAHSLGNLVVRHFLADEARRGMASRLNERLGRIVMLAPPNRGSARAALWAESTVFASAYRAVAGPAAVQISPDWDEFEPQLTVPACEFGIIAGGRGDGKGWHDQIPGDDDGTVGVAETRLAGACDFIVLPVRHTFLMNDERTLAATLRFLEEGCFVSPEACEPIPLEDLSESPLDDSAPGQGFEFGP